MVTESSGQSNDLKTGIWYSTWFTNKGHYIWATGFGIGLTKQFLADVNHDGYDDAIVFYADTGTWYVSLSNGSTFGYYGYTAWAKGFGIGSTNQFLVDVNHDGYPDAVVYNASTGEWDVAISNGSSTFLYYGYTAWAKGFGIGSTKQFLADVNGDGYPDAVVYYASTGEWDVAISNGSSTFLYYGYTAWAKGHGIGSDNQFLADVNGDGKADAVVFFKSVGDWYVGFSNGSSTFLGFGTPRWAAGFGKGSTKQLLTDYNGDPKADAIAFYPCSVTDPKTFAGEWQIAVSDNVGFKYLLSYIQHGYASSCRPSILASAQADAIFLGYVRGKYNKQDGSLKPKDPVIFTNSDGSWRATNEFSPGLLNYWESANDHYLPRLANGTYGQYDSSDGTQIDYHLDQMHDAKIDFLILDETNIMDFMSNIKEAAQEVCHRIAAKRKIDLTYPQYAIAIGAIQYAKQFTCNTSHECSPIGGCTYSSTDNKCIMMPLTCSTDGDCKLPGQALEYEAGEVWNEFANNPYCGGSDNYFKVGGKPLLVVVAGPDQIGAWWLWKLSQPSNGCSDKFTVKWAAASVGPTKGKTCDPTITCYTPITDNNLTYDSFYGFSSIDSAWTRISSEAMFIQPSWNQNICVCQKVPRSGGDFYKSDWNAVLFAKPKIAIISSYNGYSEDNAVAPTNTDFFKGTEDIWPSSDYYWNLTKTYNYQRKSSP